jgi:hypothetical protein
VTNRLLLSIALVLVVLNGPISGVVAARGADAISNAVSCFICYSCVVSVLW